MLTTRQMQYFEALAETGHFGRAAERVHVSQPALSAQIAELERDLGFAVGERRPAGAVLTSRGAEVLERIRAILQELRAIDRDARTNSLFKALCGLASSRRLHRTCCRNSFRPSAMHSRTCVWTCAKRPRHNWSPRSPPNEVDAFIAAAPIEAPGLKSAALFEDRFHVASASNERDVLVSPDLGGFPVERLLLLEEGHCLRDQALEVCGLRSGRRLVNYGATSLTTLLQMVEHGMGITLVPQIAIETECRNRRLNIVPFGNPAPSRKVMLFLLLAHRERIRLHDFGFHHS